MANVKFERGLEDDVTTEIPTDGHLYVGTDTGNMYLGKNDGTKLPIGQSDWNQTDGTKSDFIKNKPEIPKERVYIAGDNVEITALTDLYTPVEYIKNDARTYINTGIAPQATDFEMELVASLVAGGLYIFQHRQTNNDNILGFYRPDSSIAPMRLYAGTSTYVTTELPSNKVDVFSFVGSVKDGKATITSKNLGTGEEKSGEATIEETPSVGTRRFCLFGNGLGVDSSWTSGVNTRIYKARIVQSGVLVMDFIPVVRKSDGRAGFYDLVTGGFFTDIINDESVLSAGPSISKEYNIVSVPDIPTDTSDLTNGAGFITITDVPTVTVPEYTVEKLSSAEQGYASSYVLKKDGTQVGATINIPKDMVVSSGEVKTVTTANQPYTGAQVGDKYIDLTIANASQDHIYIPVKDLVDVYTAGNGISINSNNEISAKVSEGNGLGFVANGDIALSLVQNSANGAMSSDDFRKLYDNVEMAHLLGTEYPLNNWYINSNGNYASSTTYKSYLIPVSSIGKVSIYDSATTTYYSFLKPYEEGGSSNVPDSTDYAYATGYTGRKAVAEGTTSVVSVPSDATWLWVYSGNNKGYDPTSLKFTGIAIGIADGIPSPASNTPLMDGSASVGTSTDYAREDHVHPSDTSRVPTTRTVNGKALSADITLDASDVGALPSSTVIPADANLVHKTGAETITGAKKFTGMTTVKNLTKDVFLITASGVWWFAVKTRLVAGAGSPNYTIHIRTVSQNSAQHSNEVTLDIRWHASNNAFTVRNVRGTGTNHDTYYAFTYTEDGVKYVAIGMKKPYNYQSFYFSVDLVSDQSMLEGWTYVSSAEKSDVIPDVGTDDCVELFYVPTTIPFGGTGGITAKGAEYNLTPNLATVLDTDFVDAAQIPCVFANSASTANGRFYGVRTALKMWNYIKSKIASVLGISSTTNGVPLAPTAAAGTATTQIATTAFVGNAVGGLATEQYVDEAIDDIVIPSYSAFDGASDSAAGSTGLVPAPTMGQARLLASDATWKTLSGTVSQGSPNPVTSGGVFAALQGKQDALTFDSTPTAGSPNPVTSGGVFAALQGNASNERKKVWIKNPVVAEYYLNSKTLCYINTNGDLMPLAYGGSVIDEFNAFSIGSSIYYCFNSYAAGDTGNKEVWSSTDGCNLSQNGAISTDGLVVGERLFLRVHVAQNNRYVYTSDTNTFATDSTLLAGGFYVLLGNVTENSNERKRFYLFEENPLYYCRVNNNGIPELIDWAAYLTSQTSTPTLIGEHGVSVTTDQTSGGTNLGLSSEWLYYAFWYKYTALYDLSGENLPIDAPVIDMSNLGFEFPKAGWYFVSAQILVDITNYSRSSMIHAELMWDVDKGTRHPITALSISVPNGGVVPLNMQGVFLLNNDPVNSFVISLKMEITDGSANIVVDAPTGGSWIEDSDHGSNIFIRRLNPYH